MLCHYCTPKTQPFCTACGGIGVLYCCEGAVGGPSEVGTYQGSSGPVDEPVVGVGAKKKVDKSAKQAHRTLASCAVS